MNMKMVISQHHTIHKIITEKIRSYMMEKKMLCCLKNATLYYSLSPSTHLATPPSH